MAAPVLWCCAWIKMREHGEKEGGLLSIKFWYPVRQLHFIIINCLDGNWGGGRSSNPHITGKFQNQKMAWHLSWQFNIKRIFFEISQGLCFSFIWRFGTKEGSYMSTQDVFTKTQLLVMLVYHKCLLFSSLSLSLLGICIYIYTVYIFGHHLTDLAPSSLCWMLLRTKVPGFSLLVLWPAPAHACNAVCNEKSKQGTALRHDRNLFPLEEASWQKKKDRRKKEVRGGRDVSRRSAHLG